MESTVADIAQELAELKTRVTWLQDRHDILDCINVYGRGLDRLDADLIRNAYHPDAIDNHGPFVGGVKEFVPFAIEIESSFKVTHHGITSHNCEITLVDVAHAEKPTRCLRTDGRRQDGWCRRRSLHRQVGAAPGQVGDIGAPAADGLDGTAAV